MNTATEIPSRRSGQRAFDFLSIPAGRAAMIDREKINREMHEIREIGKSSHWTSTPTRGSEEMALAVSSQVMAWLATNIATEKPARQFGRRELDFFSIPAGRAAIIDREKINREMHEIREIGKSSHWTSTPARGSEEMALAVSSQVMAWLVTNIATEKPARQSGRREVDVFSIPADRAAMIDREKINREKHENREIGKSPHSTSTSTRGGEEMALAVSSQVMAWLVTNIATEKPARRSGRREVDVFSIPADRAAMSRTNFQDAMARTVVLVVHRLIFVPIVANCDRDYVSL